MLPASHTAGPSMTLRPATYAYCIVGSPHHTGVTIWLYGEFGHMALQYITPLAARPFCSSCCSRLQAKASQYAQSPSRPTLVQWETKSVHFLALYLWPPNFCALNLPWAPWDYPKNLETVTLPIPELWADKQDIHTKCLIDAMLFIQLMMWLFQIMHWLLIRLQSYHLV